MPQGGEGKNATGRRYEKEHKEHPPKFFVKRHGAHTCITKRFKLQTLQTNTSHLKVQYIYECQVNPYGLRHHGYHHFRSQSCCTHVQPLVFIPQLAARPAKFHVQSCADHICIQKYIMDHIAATAPHIADVPLSNFPCVAPSPQENHVKYQSFDHTSLR